MPVTMNIQHLCLRLDPRGPVEGVPMDAVAEEPTRAMRFARALLVLGDSSK